MKNKELLYAIGEIDDKFIRIAAPIAKNNPKRYALRWLAVAACLCFVLVGIGMWQGGMFEPMVDLPEYNAIGGEGNFEYERAYAPKLYQLDSALMDYIVESGGTDLYQWLEQVTEETKKYKYNISDPQYVPSLIRTIEKYNIPKEEFERINNDNISDYEKSGDHNLIEQVCYTQEEVDALYSKNAAKIAEAFATKYAIIVGDKVYAPNFYLNASEKELKKYDIPVSKINKKTALLLKDGVITETTE